MLLLTLGLDSIVANFSLEPVHPCLRFQPVTAAVRLAWVVVGGAAVCVEISQGWRVGKVEGRRGDGNVAWEVVVVFEVVAAV